LLHFLLIVSSKTNILVNDKGEALLCDFGLARLLEYSGCTTDNIVGTARWMAPELIVSGPVLKLPQVTTCTDVWAFAMTALEVSHQLMFKRD
jgi:serine/threonine protein kinase